MPSVRDILATKGTDVATIEPDKSILDAVALMNDRRIGALIVVEDERVVGIFTERDLLTRIVGQRDPAATLVREVMTTKLAVCTRDTGIESCRTAMSRHKIRHLPVIEDGKLVGLISSGDILARELEAQAETIKFLHEYMTGPN
jgi:CBS domain-containing protein